MRLVYLPMVMEILSQRSIIHLPTTALIKRIIFLELRVPWTLINFTNPNTKEILGDIYVDGIESTIKIDGIKVSLASYNSSIPEVLSTFPESDSGIIPGELSHKYTWEPWNEVETPERLKQSYYIIKDIFSKY